MRFWFAAAAIFLLLPWTTPAQDPPPSLKEPLKVGVFDHPPFAMKDDSGAWTGLAVELWERVAAKLNLPFEYVEIPLDRALVETSRGHIDVLVGAVGVTADGERKVNFTQPFLSTSAGVALLKSGWLPHSLEFVGDVFENGVLSIIGMLLLALLGFSLLLWIVERRANNEHFGGKPINGFGSALWFAAVTMTTVGYGDKTPRTFTGRAIVFVWMFFGIFAVGLFTATLASSIAVSRTKTSVRSVQDLSNYRCGVLEGSVLQRLSSGLGLRTVAYETDAEGLQALSEKKITAFVDIEMSLRYLINQNYPGQMFIEMLPSTHVGMAFATCPQFPYLDELNVEIVEDTMGIEWTQEIDRWLGPPVR